MQLEIGLAEDLKIVIKLFRRNTKIEFSKKIYIKKSQTPNYISLQEYPEIARDVVIHLVQRMDSSQRSDMLKTLTTLEPLVLQNDRQTESGLQTPDGSDNTH